MGGVSGHAGLFSRADDIVLLQVMLNGGSYKHVSLFNKRTICSQRRHPLIRLLLSAGGKRQPGYGVDVLLMQAGRHTTIRDGPAPSRLLIPLISWGSHFDQ